MTELLKYYALDWAILMASIELGQRLTVNGDLRYDPRDFSYWGA